MAIVDIPGRKPIEVPDTWGSDEVTDFVRQSYPDLFEGPALSTPTYGPDRAPLSPDARAARIAAIRGTPAENRRFAEDQSRIADLDALEAARQAGGVRSFLEASDIMAGPRRVAAGASNFLRVPGAIANIQLAPLFMSDATRPAADRIAQLLKDLDRGITGAGDVLRSSERPDAEPTLADVFRSGRDIGPAAALADLGTLGVNAVADSAAYILPGGAMAKLFASVGMLPKLARFLGPMISVSPVETADALSEYLDTNADPVAARFLAPVVGFINGAFESLTDSKILGRLGGGDAAKKSAVKFVLGQIFGEGGTEVLQEGTTIGGRVALTGDPGPEPLNRLATAGVGGTFGGAGISGVTEAIRRLNYPDETTPTTEVPRSELAPDRADPAPGMVRLYRGDTRGADVTGGVPAWVRESPEYKATVDASGRWFTTSLSAAEEYRSKFGDGSGPVTFVDVPAAEAAKYNVANQPEAAKFTSGGATGALAAEEFFLPREVAQQAKVFPVGRDTPPPLGKRKVRKALNFARIAEEEGVADLVDFVPEAKMTPDGVPIEAEFSNGRTTVYTPNVRNEARFRGALREEKAHGWIATAPGQEALSEFLTRQPLTEAEVGKLREEGYLPAEGETPDVYTRRLSDEFVAKLNRDPKWRQWIGEAVAWVKKSIGVSLTNTQAGRLMLRNLRRAGVGQSGGQSRQSVDVVGSERKNLPDWAREEMVRRGMDPKRVLNDVDLGNPSVQEAIQLDPSLTEDQKARLLSTGSLRKTATPDGSPTPARFSLAPEKVPSIVAGIQRQFPSAPPIVVSETPDPRGAYFDGTSIVVSPDTLPGNPAAAKSVVTAALIESGLTKVFGEDFVGSTFAMLRAGDPMRTARMAERLGADTKTPEGQRAVLSEVLRLQQDSVRMAPFLRRWMQKLRLVKTDKLSEALDRAARTTLAAYEGSEPIPGGRATAQDQIYADLNRSVWTYARPFIQSIRNIAIEERLDAEDTARHRNMSNRMNALADNARARDIGAGVEQAWNPVDEDFMDRLDAAGVPTTESDRTLHEAYRREALARGLVLTLDTLDRVDTDIADVMRAKPGYDIANDELTTEQTALRKRISDADPDVLTRAQELRSHSERRWKSRAAVDALRDPQVAAWADIVERIEASGATPREGPVSDNLADAATVARDTLALTWSPFRRRTQEAYDKFMTEVYPAALTPLRERLERLRSDRAQAQIAVGEILAALRGVMGLSGSVEDRATAEFLQENDELLRRFIVALAQTSPDTALSRLRDRIFRIPDSAPAYTEAQAQLDAELGASTFIEVPRYEVSGITADDVRALFGTDSRTANPDLYEWFAKQPASVKKEVVKAAMKGAVDARLAQFGSRRQVGVDRVEVPGRAPTADELQERFTSLIRERMAAEGLADIQRAAEAAGLSFGALQRLVEQVEGSPGFRNAITETFGAVNRSIEEAAITAIRRVEFAVGGFASQTVGEGPVNRRAAAIMAAPFIERLTRSRGRASDAMTGVERDIRELEVRRLQLELLRDAGAAEIPESELGVAEMIYDGADGGVIFKGFTKADGTEQEQITLRPGEEYTNATLARLGEWQENARAAVEAESNEAPVTRGLNVGVQIANQFIDASFTPDQIAGTPAPGMLGDLTRGSLLTLGQNIGNRNTLSRSVFGVQGRALMAAARDLDLAGQTKDAITKSYVRRHYRAMRDAADSLGLNLFTPGDSRLLKKARNEVAHRFGRVFEAGPAVGELLIGLPGKRITPELMTLIRLDREIGRKAQEKERNRHYGGVRVNLTGQRIMRPPAETGDVGLSRTFQGHLDNVRELAETHQSKDPVRIIAFWDSPKSEDGLRWHILDAERSDLGTPRQLRGAEIIAARQITHGHVPAPKNFDEAVSLLVDVSGLSRSEIRSKLLSELAEYGRLASAKYPEDGSRPKEVEGTFSGEGDQTPFTMQAAPLIYPSSWYDYGSASSLDQFLEMVVDVPQRAYLTRAKESAVELEATAERIRKAVAEGDIAELKNLDGVIRWYTNKAVSFWRGQKVTSGRAEKAARYMTWVAKQLRADIAPTSVSKVDDALSRTIGGIMPMLLSGMNAMLTNVVQGPLTSFFINRPLAGSARADGVAIGRMLLAAGNFAQDRAEEALKKLGFEFRSHAEQLAFLEGYGVAGSYSRMEYGESEAWSRGETTAGPIRRTVQLVQDVANRVSEIKGVRLGDTFFNRMAVRSIIPGWIRRMQRVHDAWAARLEKEGLTYDENETKTHLSTADVAGAPDIRQQLGQFAAYGGTPEQILMRIAGVKPKLFFRDDVVGRIGSFLLSELNAATRSNRPQSNPLLALMGWTSHVIGLIAADVRTTPNTNRAKALAQIATRTLGFATVSAFAAYLGMVARRGLNVGRTDLAEALQRILLGLDDDDDIDGILDAMSALARAIRKIPGASYPLDFTARLAGALKTPATDSRMLPIDLAWWGQPASDMAMDLMAAPVRGLGIDPENPKFPTFGIVYTLAQAGLQSGRGVLEMAAGDEGSVAAGKADVSEGIRKVSTLLSMFGTVPYNMVAPGAIESKAAKAEVVRAARAVGIPIEAPKRGAFGGLIPATPVEAALRNAARDGDENKMRALAKFAFDRSYERAIDKGQTPDEARSAGESSVKSLLTALDPVRDAVGASITPEQYAKLEPKLGPRVRAEMQNRDRAVQVLSERPPEGMRTFRPTPSMMSPIRQGLRGGGSVRRSAGGRRRRPSLLARRRSAGRRVRRPRLRV